MTTVGAGTARMLLRLSGALSLLRLNPLADGVAGDAVPPADQDLCKRADVAALCTCGPVWVKVVR